ILQTFKQWNLFQMKQILCSLTIAGTDPTGGAGIQAELKTFQELKSYGMSVITSVVAQKTVDVQDIYHMHTTMFETQHNYIIADITVHAFKTWMIANTDMMKMIKQKIPSLNAPYVMDPVMVTTSGSSLIDDHARTFLRDELLPLVTIV